MAIHFMFDNHTFCRLSGRPVDEAMDVIEKCVDLDGGYGFIGGKGDHHGEEFRLTIRPGEPWRLRARKLLEAAK